ncbi:MAG: hypothetical protein QOK00_2587 [Thermoleophilaceae bacterium]|nr:hypothetical protein [Thermoleophilaceae bacterium]
MILAREGGRLRVALHSAHQRQAAIAAQAWGNAEFEAPTPRDPVVAAAGAHDAGWRAWDAAPALDRRTGQPFQFLDVATELVRGHAEGVRRASERDPYVGLLVSLHTSGVLGDRFGWDRGQVGAIGLARRVRAARGPAVALTFLLARQRFLARQRLHRRTLRGRVAVEPAALWRAYDLMQVCDELSLHFATGATGERTIGPPPARHGRPATLPAFTLRSAGPRAVTMSPYPFAADRVELPLTAAYVEDRPYASADQFVAALGAATTETLVFSVGRPGA